MREEYRYFIRQADGKLVGQYDAGYIGLDGALAAIGRHASGDAAMGGTGGSPIVFPLDIIRRPQFIKDEVVLTLAQPPSSVGGAVKQ